MTDQSGGQPPTPPTRPPAPAPFVPVPAPVPVGTKQTTTEIVKAEPLPAQAPSPRADSTAERLLSVPFILVCMVGIVFGGLTLIVCFHDLPDKNKDVIETMFGVVGSSFTLIVMYYFGSSASSKAKDQTISSLSK